MWLDVSWRIAKSQLSRWVGPITDEEADKHPSQNPLGIIEMVVQQGQTYKLLGRPIINVFQDL